ncbi:MAG: Type 1 glutamine amidotransferase-like domain-containing protein [Christensenellaceae bacterium]|jgi:peptidase E|nr:Type 1 glutamine amidotransferase-like domain-containing protein [Christensenellaceae bacterium]
MDHRLLGFFSGFPSHSFPANVAERLREELTERGSLVFVSAWPAEHAKNDDDAAGMHGMFEEIGLPFARHQVVDDRMEPAHAAQWIREASCVFLMGGHPGLQMRFLRETGLDAVICDAPAAVLGVSAGAINMAERSLDTKESPLPYKGLGLADVTIKPHFTPKNQQVLETLLGISMDLPIYAMEDDSAIFMAGGQISKMGRIHWIHNGRSGYSF